MGSTEGSDHPSPPRSVADRIRAASGSPATTPGHGERSEGVARSALERALGTGGATTADRLAALKREAATRRSELDANLEELRGGAEAVARGVPAEVVVSEGSSDLAHGPADASREATGIPGAPPDYPEPPRPEEPSSEKPSTAKPSSEKPGAEEPGASARPDSMPSSSGARPTPPAPQVYGAPTGLPYTQPSTQTYGQPSPQTYGQPATQTYGQPSPRTYGQPPAPTYGQPSPPTYGQPTGRPYVQPGAQPYAPAPGTYGASPVPAGRRPDGLAQRPVPGSPAAPSPSSGPATAALVLSIASLVFAASGFFGVILALVSLQVGRGARKTARAAGRPVPGVLTAATLLAILGIVLSVVAFIGQVSS